MARRFLTRSSILAALLAGCSSQAFAQTESEAPTDVEQTDAPQEAVSAPEEANEADVVVTGSRVARAGYDAPTPTTVIGAEFLEARTPKTVVDALALLPAFRGTATPGTAANSVAGTGGSGFANMRGLGTARTLILLERERVVPTTATGLVDISLLPSALLNGIDIVTGGASAAWGSDAVAGVVNFRLDTRYSGVTVAAESVITSHGDGAGHKASVKFGSRLGANAHLVGSAEYYKTEGVGRSGSGVRDYAASDYALVTNPNGPPALAILPFVYGLNQTFGGLIVGGPLNNIEFLRDGQTATYIPCGPRTSVGYVCPSERQDLPYQRYLNLLVAPVERASGFLRATFDVSPKVTVYADALAAKSYSFFRSVPTTTAIQGLFTIRRDNAFLPAAVAGQMDAAGITTFQMGRYSAEEGGTFGQRDTFLYRASAGLKADLGGSWDFDASVNYGKGGQIGRIGNTPIRTRFANSLDSVRVNGVPTCRVNTDASSTNDDPACRPVNFFGRDAALTTPDALEYYLGTSRADTDNKQFAASASITGEPFSTWAGPVSLAMGADYRRLHTSITVDALSAATAFVFNNPQNLDGKINVKEAFAEVVIPLANETRFLQNLELNAAARVTDYSTSGTVVTWKAGLNYSPVRGIRIRGTASRDIRAPNITELFSVLTQVSTSATVVDRTTNIPADAATFVGGNLDLIPEIANTRSVGIVLEPRFLPGFALSADYYNIRVAGAILAPSAQQVVDACFAGESQSCALVYRNGVAGGTTGVVTRVDALFVNLARFKTSGLDFEASYRFPLAGGRMNVRALANYTREFVTTTLATRLDTAGSIANPHWSGDFTASYDRGRTGALLSAQYIDSGVIATGFAPGTVLNNRAGSVVYVNASASRRIEVNDHELELRFSIDNIFNKEPPPFFTVVGGNYDRYGRMFRVGVRYTM